MSTASRNRRFAHDRSSPSLVGQLYGEITALMRAVTSPTSDRRMNQLCDELIQATSGLVHAASADPRDISDKLTILCSRLRENLHPADGGELITYLLAESIREDFRLGADGTRTSASSSKAHGS